MKKVYIISDHELRKLGRYWCFYCSYETGKYAHMLDHHKVCNDRLKNWRIVLKDDKGFVCKLHPHAMRFKNGRDLWLHMYLFHRDDNEKYLNDNKVDKRKLQVLPKYVKLTIDNYIRSKEALISHWNTHDEMEDQINYFKQKNMQLDNDAEDYIYAREKEKMEKEYEDD